MRSWTSRRRRRWAGLGFWCAILTIAGSIPWIARPEPGASAFASPWTPDLRLDVGGGSESDVILDPTLDTSVVPGGSFAEITPSLTLDRSLSPTTRLRLHAGGTFERFFNEDARWISSQSLGADLVRAAPSSLRWRLSVGQDFFDDSQRDTVRRLGGWTELGLGPSFDSVALELAISLGGRRYPDVAAPDDAGVLGTYVDWSRSLRATVLVDLGGGGWLRATTKHDDTSARDSFFDSSAWLHSAALGASLSNILDVQVSALLQRRTFELRVPSEDDQYFVAQAGVTYALSPNLALLGQAGFYRYTWPDGSHQDSHRGMLGLRFSWGSAPTGNLGSLPDQPPSPLRADGSAVFRIQAPHASMVSVVGTFNGWDATAHPLRAAADGWWELALPLTPGAYQYGYVVDGAFITPPEAEVTVEDGFGGRNGWIEIGASP